MTLRINVSLGPVLSRMMQAPFVYAEKYTMNDPELQGILINCLLNATLLPYPEYCVLRINRRCFF